MRVMVVSNSGSNRNLGVKVLQEVGCNVVPAAMMRQLHPREVTKQWLAGSLVHSFKGLSARISCEKHPLTVGSQKENHTRVVFLGGSWVRQKATLLQYLLREQALLRPFIVVPETTLEKLVELLGRSEHLQRSDLLSDKGFGDRNVSLDQGSQQIIRVIQ